MRILKYLKKALRKGILYSDSSHIRVDFTDANWAGLLIDRQSITGYGVFLRGNLVSWKNKKQCVVLI